MFDGLFAGGEVSLVHGGLLLLFVSLFFYVARSITTQRWVWYVAWGLLFLSMLLLIASLWARSLTAGYFALSNMYESLLVVTISMMGGFLLLDSWFQRRGLGWPVCLMIVVSLSYCLTLPTEIHPLQAALQSYWRSIHVPVILSSYAMFTLAFVVSVVSLGLSYFKGSNSLGSAGMTPAVAGTAPDVGSTVDRMAQALDHTMLSHSLADDMTMRQVDVEGVEALSQADSVSVYDEITYRCVAIGFPLLAIGIILGGLWANEAWGNYWSWDPKESMSLVTLLGYGVYLHLRVNGQHSARTLAWVSVASFLLMLLTYFGVNLMGVGLHSYGKIG